jgi:hypothetical protein
VTEAVVARIGGAGRSQGPLDAAKRFDEIAAEFVQGLDGGDHNACASGQLVIGLRKPS